jgi:hypothetical protein
MACPYLKEVTVVFCRAYPLKKPVPIDRVTTASTCEDASSFCTCALYRDALARAGRSLEEERQDAARSSTAPLAGAADAHAVATKGGTP